MSTVRPLSKSRFEALLYRRSPFVAFVFEELERWSNADETVIATLGRDRIDHDYSWAILGRDETGVFRAFDLNASMPSLAGLAVTIWSRSLHMASRALSASARDKCP